MLISYAIIFASIRFLFSAKIAQRQSICFHERKVVSSIPTLGSKIFLDLQNFGGEKIIVSPPQYRVLNIFYLVEFFVLVIWH